jgi:SpoVK/Ycf46/Vps4 family AAA+-type ATPase
MYAQVRKSFAEENAVRSLAGDEPGYQVGHPVAHDDEDEAQMIEEALCPPDDEVEVALSKLIGLDAVKNHIRGLRRTLEIEASSGSKRVVPRHMALVGRPGTGKTTAARLLAPILFKIGAVKNRNFVEVGREDLVDKKSEARTIFKTRKVLEQALGGVLFIDEPYTLLPSTARPRNRDHGGAALREIARTLPSGSPLIIFTGGSLDLQRILASDIGFKGYFLSRIEFPDPTPKQIARMFVTKMSQKGLVPADGVTVSYLADLVATNTDDEWRLERNGRISDLLLVGVRAELKKRTALSDEVSRVSLSPMKMLSPGSSRMPALSPEEVFVTVEDIQNAIVNGM